jgi:hypothetical protein
VRKIETLVFGCLLIALSVGLLSTAQATTDSAWDSNATITEKFSYTQAGTPIDATKTLPCKRYIHTNAANNAVNYCVFSTGKYTVTDDSKILVLGLSDPIALENKANTNGLLIPLPSSSDMVEIRGSGSNSKVVIISNAYSGMQTVTLPNGKFKKQITSASQTIVTDTLNNVPLISLDYRNISANGNWLISQNGNGIYKLNLLSKELQYIRDPIVAKNGLSPQLSLSISNDGRYASVYSGREQKFEIIDTYNCHSNTSKIGKDAKCTFVDYMGKIKSSVNNLYTSGEFRNVNFVGNNSVRFFAYSDWVSPTNYKLKEIILATNKQATSTLDYLALGDSYASGEGVFNYKSITDEDINRCHLSELSYPYSFMNKGVVGSGESIACSGARVKDIINVNRQEYVKDDPQSSFYSLNPSALNVLNNYIPGGIRQKDFIDEYRPNIITLSVGGNDIGFSKIITSCVAGASECFETRQERQRLVSIIENTYRNLVRTYTEIKDVNPDARIYIIGYPQVAKVDGNCAVNVGLTNNEIAFTRDLIAYLNSVIEMAANEAGVYYTNTEYAFDGRRLCETESSLSAMNGLTAGPDSGVPGFISGITGINGPLGQESYHPNIFGHNMFSKKILEETDSLTKPMPNSSPGNPLADSVEKSAFLNAVEVGDEYGLNAYYDESITKDTFTKDDKVQIVVDGEIYFVKPNSQINAYMYSTPTFLGTTSADANGNISGEFSVPDSLEPGYHTLHLYATNIENKVIDIQKIIYVAASETDFDGDGVLNTDEVCLVGESSGLDSDEDGIDDACDGFIDTPPTGEQNQSETPPIDVVDEQPIIISTDKELPVSESRPEWLLMKEREIAAEQAAANQSATVTQPEDSTTAPTTPVTTTNTQQTAVDTTTNEPALDDKQPTTQVAGVSSAVETKESQQTTHNYWWLYLITGVLVIIFGVGIYRYITEENKV